MEILNKRIEDFTDEFFLPASSVEGVSIERKIKRIHSFFDFRPKFNHCVIFLDSKKIPIGVVDRKTAFKTYYNNPDEPIRFIKGKVALFEGIENYPNVDGQEKSNIFYPNKTINEALEAIVHHRYGSNPLDYILVIEENSKELVTFFTYKDVLRLLRDFSGVDFRTISIRDIEYTKDLAKVYNDTIVEDRPRDKKNSNAFFRSYPVIEKGSEEFLGLLFDASITHDDHETLYCSDSRVMTHLGRFSDSVLTEDDNLNKAIKGFMDNPLHTSLPIIKKGKNSKMLIGLISYTDIFRHFIAIASKLT